MKRILVILHIWYQEQIDYFIDKMGNISGCEWDLLVTTTHNDPQIADKLLAFRSNAKIITVPNIGYDIGPFIRIIKSYDISQYDYILKLHTKGALPKKARINGVNLQGLRWRNLLVNSLIGTTERFQKVLNKMDREDVGMVCCYELYKYLHKSLPEDTYMLDKEAARIGVQIVVNKFLAGSMFIVKTKALTKLIKAQIDVDSWDKFSESQSIGSEAHVYERLLCAAVTDAGYKIALSPASTLSATQALLHNIGSIFKRRRGK